MPEVPFLVGGLSTAIAPKMIGIARPGNTDRRAVKQRARGPGE
jgi:hypothetical protein